MATYMLPSLCNVLLCLCTWMRRRIQLLCFQRALSPYIVDGVAVCSATWSVPTDLLSTKLVFFVGRRRFELASLAASSGVGGGGLLVSKESLSIVADPVDEFRLSLRVEAIPLSTVADSADAPLASCLSTSFSTYRKVAISKFSSTLCGISRPK